MRIMSESEYMRCIEAAEKRGYERALHEAYLDRERSDFQKAVFRELEDLRRGFQNRIDRLEKEIGNEDAPTICVCGVRSEREENDG